MSYTKTSPLLFNSAPYRLLACLVGLLLAVSRALAAASDRCDVCDSFLYGSCYLIEDQITHEKKQVCAECALKRPDCYLCALPTLTNAPGAAVLNDGRVICSRDARTAVLSEEEGLKICKQVADDLSRQVVRFLTLPEENVGFAVVDRLHLQVLYKNAGIEYHCPNVLGYMHKVPGLARREYEISILSGLPLGWFRATCAHECAHAWMTETLSERRLTAMDDSAKEGFCELLAYLYVDAAGDQATKKKILENAYTRGQIQVFVEAEQRYGLNDIVDWMKRGEDARLRADDLGRVRVLRRPRTTAAPNPLLPPVYVTPPTPKAPDRLVLKAVLWNPARPSAIINDRSFFVNEQASVRVAETNRLIRCPQIRQDSVRVRDVATGEDQELSLKGW